jgi:membrane-bound metal-dependent hydrolase YbcI (DUF457 family)
LDSITHGLLSFLLLGGLFDWRLGGYVALLGVLPDFDIFLLPLSGKYPLLRHRSIVHSIPFMVLLPPLFAFLAIVSMFLFFPFLSLSYLILYFLILYVLGTIAFGLHLLIDYLTYYGAPILWPIKKYRINYDIFGVVSAPVLIFSMVNLTMLVISIYVSSLSWMNIFPICSLISIFSYIGLFCYFIILKIKNPNQRKQGQRKRRRMPFR